MDRKEKSAGPRAPQLERAALGGLLVMVPGILRLVSGNLWLFPSLGPSCFMQVETSHPRTVQPYHVVGGHLIGTATAYLSVIVLGGLGGIPPALAMHQLLPVHVLTSGFAVALMILDQFLASADHPPAASTTLLLTLGGFRLAWTDLSLLLVGIAIMGLSGEVARQWVIARAIDPLASWRTAPQVVAPQTADEAVPMGFDCFLGGVSLCGSRASMMRNRVDGPAHRRETNVSKDARLPALTSRGSRPTHPARAPRRGRRWSARAPP